MHCDLLQAQTPLLALHHQSQLNSLTLSCAVIHQAPLPLQILIVHHTPNNVSIIKQCWCLQALPLLRPLSCPAALSQMLLLPKTLPLLQAALLFTSNLPLTFLLFLENLFVNLIKWQTMPLSLLQAPTQHNPYSCSCCCICQKLPLQ